MTDAQAENIVKEILRLRYDGIKEETELFAALNKKYDVSEQDFGWILETISTGAFRAASMINGSPYPKANLWGNPILKAAFRLYWIEQKGEEDYDKRWGNHRSEKEIKKPFWQFWKKN